MWEVQLNKLVLYDKERAFLQKSADNYVQNKEDYLHQVEEIS